MIRLFHAFPRLASALLPCALSCAPPQPEPGADWISPDASLPADQTGTDAAADVDASAAWDAAEGADATGALDVASGDRAARADGAGRDDHPVTPGGDAGNIWERCFADIYDPDVASPDYDSFAPTYGSHCFGTNHQDIRDVERVVFLGDSVTVGTPPTPKEQFYRSRLAVWLAQRFDLEPPSALWQSANPITGEATVAVSGDFATCAKWGARVDDLRRDRHQIEDCIPPDQRHKRHLVIMTMGGNDLSAITQDGAHAPYEQSRARFEEAVALLRDALTWLKSPAQFPGGVDVVFTNMFEFTDGTGRVNECAAAGLSGLEPWEHPEWLEELVIWTNTQYMAIAVETRTDMVMMLEQFCGHGFARDDPNARCYRGPDAEQWLDFTCIHPNPTGHERLAAMFEGVIAE